MAQTAVSLPKGSGSRQRLRTALATIHANFTDLFTRVASVEESAPEWIFEDAITDLDFENERFWADGAEQSLEDVLEDGSYGNWAGTLGADGLDGTSGPNLTALARTGLDFSVGMTVRMDYTVPDSGGEATVDFYTDGWTWTAVLSASRTEARAWNGNDSSQQALIVATHGRHQVAVNLSGTALAVSYEGSAINTDTNNAGAPAGEVFVGMTPGGSGFIIHRLTMWVARPNGDLPSLSV
jgi:hypothetical protein